MTTSRASRTRWVIGNWKQHLLRARAADHATQVADGISTLGTPQVRMAVAPTFLALDAVGHALRKRSHAGPGIALFAQDSGAAEEGAFTGEVGPAMLREAGVTGVIVGHSERRHGLGESDPLIAKKTRCALDAGLTTVLCVGEPLAARERGSHEEVVRGQLEGALAGLAGASHEGTLAHLVVAYEPVWAIGTGLTATPEQAGAMHAVVRAWLAERFGDAGRDRSVLYGGSVNPKNAASLREVPDIDGFLVGGASLQASDFVAIARTCAEQP